MADLFVDASHPDKLRPSIERFIEILFGHPFHTPTRMEYGMFHAQGAALRSADLSRQVGAAIANEDGEILALGMNEVPKGGGGLYWEGGDETDNRDFTMGFDVSTEIKRGALRQLLDRLHQRGWLEKPADDLLDEAWNAVSGTSLMNVGEFGRQVHAEMAAIVDAARRGVSILGQTLYTTTFPCHVCARHIVSAGIARVVYNEPYPKSLAGSLHLDSIAIDDDEDRDTRGRTHFVPFVGLAPHLYVKLFRMEGQGWRKDENSEIVNWTKAQARPRLSNAPATYIPKEVGALKRFIKLSAPEEEDQIQAEPPGA